MALLEVNVTEDGFMEEGTDSDYATMRGAAGDAVSRTATTMYCRLIAAASGTNYNLMDRAGLVFDTAALGAGSTVTDAHLGIRATGKSNGLGTPSYNITAFAPADPTTLVAGDYDSFSDTELATAIAQGSISTSAYTEWTLNASGLSAISLTSYTKFMFRDSWDIANSFGGSYVNSAQTYVLMSTVEGTSPAYLHITYTEAGGSTIPLGSTDACTAGTSLTLNYNAAGASTNACSATTSMGAEKDNGLGSTNAALSTTSAAAQMDNGLGSTITCLSNDIIILDILTPGSVELLATINGVSTVILQANIDHALAEIVGCIAATTIDINADFAFEIESDGQGGTEISLSTGTSPTPTVTTKTFWYDKGTKSFTPRCGNDAKNAHRYTVKLWK